MKSRTAAFRRGNEPPVTITPNPECDTGVDDFLHAFSGSCVSWFVEMPSAMNQTTHQDPWRCASNRRISLPPSAGFALDHHSCPRHGNQSRFHVGVVEAFRFVLCRASNDAENGMDRRASGVLTRIDSAPLRRLVEYGGKGG